MTIPDILEAMGLLLDEIGYKTVLAKSACVAKQILENTCKPWSAMITDFNMPGETGLELIIGAKESGIKFDYVILVSAAHNMKESAEYFRRENITTLNKPFTSESLLEALGRDSQDY